MCEMSNEQSANFLLGKLFAILTIAEAEENDCYCQQTQMWQEFEKLHYPSMDEGISQDFIISHAEKLFFQKRDKQVFKLIRKIAILFSEDANQYNLRDIQFRLGFWSALPDDICSEDDYCFESRSYSGFDNDDCIQFEKIQNKYPGAIPGYAMHEVPHCYLSLVDDGQYE